MSRRIIIVLVLGMLAFSLSPAQGQEVIEAWVARYNGPGNGSDAAYALALDDSGNVFVTGNSSGSGTGSDYATIKYDPEGNQLWEARYNGPGNGSDWAVAIALDDSGNVYVTGSSEGSETGTDYATIKYDPDGVEQWVARYNSPGNGYDNAQALALDESGNVYVTGESEGIGTSNDYATIKYDPGGNQLWIALYDGPASYEDQARALALDDSGHVYVTGWSYDTGSISDYTTIKYNANGSVLWVARYNGPGNNEDQAFALAVDDSGHVYVMGYSVGIDTNFDYATVKYNADGTELWVARYNSPGNNYDRANALALDDSGNVYVTGRSLGNVTGLDYATVKYDPDGNELWATRYDGPVNDYDEANALAVDAYGNVYVTGWSDAGGPNYDYATIKYDLDGSQQWVARYNGPVNNYDRANALALDDSANVYVTGWSIGSGMDYDYATIKYSQIILGRPQNRPLLFCRSPIPIPSIRQRRLRLSCRWRVG